MRPTGWFAAMTVLGAALPLAGALHEEGCPYTFADPNTVIVIDLTDVGGGLFYQEIRDDLPIALGAFAPASAGYPFGDGIWLYEEVNGLANLQRGGIGLLGPVFPPPPWPCDVFCVHDEDPITDENCGHGRDRIIY